MEKISVIGGGLVGSLLSVYLIKRGYDVTVYEKRPDMRTVQQGAGRSINMACSMRGWRALDAVGVGDRVRKSAIAMYGRVMHATDSSLSYQPYGLENQAIYSISRSGLNIELMNYAEEQGVKFCFEYSSKKVDLDKGEILFSVGKEGKEVVVKSDRIFGADGVFSSIRNAMQRKRHFNYSQTFISSDYKELHIPPSASGGFAMEKNALHIWPRGNFMMIALPNPDGSFTCTLFMPYEGKKSFAGLQSEDEIMEFFLKEFPDAVPLMPDLVERFQRNPQAPLLYIKCFPWTYQDKVGLIGDASHAIVPFYGQGMNSGFEDCFVLDQIIGEHEGDWSKIMKSYEIARKENADAIADLAVYNYYEMRDRVADEDFLLQKKLEKRIQELYPQRYMPLYSMVSFSHTPYAEALRKGEEQDVEMKTILEQYDVAQMIKDNSLDTWIHEYFANKN